MSTQATDQDKDFPMPPISGPYFHGEDWYACPRCRANFEYWDTIFGRGFTKVKDKLYKHDKCGQIIDMT